MRVALIRTMIGLVFVLGSPVWAEEGAFIKAGERVVFLGDSITHAGQYISVLEAKLRQLYPSEPPELINLGLPSETCSGLSEPDHPFPRPDVHERLDRALEKTKPDIVVACYGMNDGIYYPFSEERFAAYRKGINKLIKKVDDAGARLVLMTPPPFDPLPLKKKGKLKGAGEEKYAWFSIYEDYDEVLARYAKWVMGREPRVEMVIDLHTPVNDYIAERRKTNPDHMMSGDGVHLNEEGHLLLGLIIGDAWGLSGLKETADSEMAVIKRRQDLLHAAWLSHVGHKRPGVKAGLPLDKARKKAAEMEKELEKLRRD